MPNLCLLPGSDSMTDTCENLMFVLFLTCIMLYYIHKNFYIKILKTLIKIKSKLILFQFNMFLY